MSAGNRCDCCEEEPVPCPLCDAAPQFLDRSWPLTWNGNSLTASGGSGGVSLGAVVSALFGIDASAACVDPNVEADICVAEAGYTDGSDEWNIVACFWTIGGSTYLRLFGGIDGPGVGELSVYDSGSIVLSAAETFDCDALNESGTATRCYGTYGSASASYAITSTP